MRFNNTTGKMEFHPVEVKDLEKQKKINDSDYDEFDNNPPQSNRNISDEIVLSLVREELRRARNKHTDMPSMFHGKAVIEEELDELWDLIKLDKAKLSPFENEVVKRRMVEEAVQVAAMGVRFVVDLLA